MTRAGLLLGAAAVSLGIVVVVVMNLTAGGEDRPIPSQQSTARARPSIDLDEDPRIVEYQLRRLSNQQLMALERTPDDRKYQPVYEALLSRSGLNRNVREEAVRAVATLKKSDVITESLSAITRIGSNNVVDEEGRPIHGHLGQIVLGQPHSELARKRQLLEETATQSDSIHARQAAFAALVLTDPAESVWDLASQSEEGLLALVQALASIVDPQRTEPFYPKVRSLLSDTRDSDLRRAIVAVLPSFPQHRRDSFKILAALIQNTAEPLAAIRAVLSIPKSDWAPEEVEPLLDHVVRHVGQVPAAQRTESSFMDALQLATDLSSLLDPVQIRDTRALLDDLRVRVIVIETVPDSVRFNKTQIVAEVGEQIQLVLENRDFMQHNLVLTVPGALEEIGTAAETMALEPDAQGRAYVPASRKVLQATKLVAPNAKEALTFVAPDEPGSYPYLCTFPTHWRTMYGELLVVADMNEYLANPARFTAGAQVTEWNFADLAPELSKVSADRRAQGQQVFSSAGCVRCHRYRELGADFGPDLTDVFDRWDNGVGNAFKQLMEPSGTIKERFRNAADVLKRDDDSDRNVLRQIVEPSSTIKPQYMNYVVTLRNGSIETGMIIRETDTSLTIQSGPGEELARTIDKGQIAERRPQNSSPMPNGLLNFLKKDDILDLLAFLKYGSSDSPHTHVDDQR